MTVWPQIGYRPTCSGSGTSVVPGDAEGRYDVRQHGPRRLWNEVEAAHRWWRHSGEPRLEDWEFVVTPDQQTGRPTRPGDGLLG